MRDDFEIKKQPFLEINCFCFPKVEEILSKKSYEINIQF